MPLQTERIVQTVSEITRQVRFTLEETFQGVWVEGEISNFKLHTSGHMYFSLKDSEAQIQCVMFRMDNRALNFEMTEGLSVVCYGRVSVYAPRGQYQLYVEKVEPKGIGALQLKFEQLKEKLRKEGLFDEAHKKEIPFLPSRIGIITSQDGAALHDILKVLDRRFSSVQILIYPVKVQGVGSAESITEAIQDFNELRNVDVLIIGRGGGSLEDLWSFNEEIVARAIYDSKIPIISAVGHEVDFTIADFVADLRAATPSQAAEIVLPVKEELLMRIEALKARASQSILGQIQYLKQELKRHTSSRVFKNLLTLFEIQFQKLDELKKSMNLSFLNFVRFKSEKINALLGKLEAMGPVATLKRGFSVSLKLPAGKIISSIKEIKVGDMIQTKLKDGSFKSQILEV